MASGDLSGPRNIVLRRHRFRQQSGFLLTKRHPFLVVEACDKLTVSTTPRLVRPRGPAVRALEELRLLAVLSVEHWSRGPMDKPLQGATETAAVVDGHLQVALDNMPGALVYTDENLNIVFCNDRFREMYPVPADLLRPGQPYPQFLRYLASHGYHGDGDVEALVARRVESLRHPTERVSRTSRPTADATGSIVARLPAVR